MKLLLQRSHVSIANGAPRAFDRPDILTISDYAAVVAGEKRLAIRLLANIFCG